jgi:hypothetical protein
MPQAPVTATPSLTPRPSLHPHSAVLPRVQSSEIIQPELLARADMLDNVRIPNAVHVRSAIKPANLRSVTALVLVVADVTGLVHILEAMDEEPTSKTSVFDRLGLVPDDEPELVDLVDHAALLGIVGREP